MQTQLTSDPEGVVYTDTIYDALGRVKSVSNPYRSTSDSTYGVTQYAYDALGRPTATTEADGSVLTGSYSANTVTATDEAGKKRKVQTDGLGRMTAVWEDPAGLNYETDYQYDTLGNLTLVTQGGQTRSYVYDMLSRVTSETNPESGTTSYGYDSCSGGELCTRIKPRANQTDPNTKTTTTYAYDALHRLTAKSYDDGVTSGPSYFYDQTAPWGATLSNPIGRLTTEYSGISTPHAASMFSYDAMGRVITNGHCTPANCGVAGYDVYYSRDLTGNVTNVHDDVNYTNQLSVSYQYDTAGRPQAVTSNYSDPQHPATLFSVDSSSGYYPHGALRKGVFGNGLTQSNLFEPRLQPCRTSLNSSGGFVAGCDDAPAAGNVEDYHYTYGAWGSTNSGNVTNWVASGTRTFNRGYTYDPLNRISSMSAPGDTCSGLNWTYDALGNRTAQTQTGGSCFAPQFLFNTKNQISGAPYQYDAAGNLTNDGSHSYTYDAENRLTKVDGGTTASYFYDAEGRRVQKTASGKTIDYVYDLTGHVIEEKQVSPSATMQASYVYFGGGLLAEYKDGTTYFVHQDHLGSARLLTAAGPSTRIQSSGGAHTWKYYISGECLSVVGKTYTISVLVKNQGTAPMKISGNIVDGPVISPGTTQQVSFTEVGNGVSCAQLGFATLNVGDPMDVVAYAPAIYASGVNLIPSANQDFSGWAAYQGAVVTVSEGQAAFVLDNLDYLPFGEQVAGGSTTTHKFTGDERDSETNLDHTWFRQYSSTQGRWLTPDPAGLAAVDPGNPQSWNRYGYVINNPLGYVDPFGLNYDYWMGACAFRNIDKFGPAESWYDKNGEFHYVPGQYYGSYNVMLFCLSSLPSSPTGCVGSGCQNSGGGAANNGSTHAATCTANTAGSGGIGGAQCPAAPTPAQRCQQIYDNYKKAIKVQKWKNVDLVFEGLSLGCAADRKSCLTGDLIPTIVGGTAADLALYHSNFNTDPITSQYQDQALAAGCQNVSW